MQNKKEMSEEEQALCDCKKLMTNSCSVFLFASCQICNPQIWLISEEAFNNPWNEANAK